jgi:hypothetical protein
MLKRLKARAIHTELEPADDAEAFALPTVKRWRRDFHQRRTDLFDDPIFGRLLRNDVAKAIDSSLKKGRSVRARCFVATSGLERRRVCESFTTSHD